MALGTKLLLATTMVAHATSAAHATSVGHAISAAHVISVVVLFSAVVEAALATLHRRLVDPSAVVVSRVAVEHPAIARQLPGDRLAAVVSGAEEEGFQLPTVGAEGEVFIPREVLVGAANPVQ